MIITAMANPVPHASKLRMSSTEPATRSNASLPSEAHCLLDPPVGPTPRHDKSLTEPSS